MFVDRTGELDYLKKLYKARAVKTVYLKNLSGNWRIIFTDSTFLFMGSFIKIYL